MELDDDRSRVVFLAVFFVVFFADPFAVAFPAVAFLAEPLAVAFLVTGLPDAFLVGAIVYHLSEPTARIRFGVDELAPSRRVGLTLSGSGVLSGRVGASAWPTMHMMRSPEPTQA